MCFLTVFLTACGWRSVYYQPAAEQSVDTTVVEIAPVPNEQGRQLVQKLHDILNPTDDQVEKKYVLNVQLSEDLDTEQGIIGDNTATRATMRITAQFQLVDKSNGKAVIDESTFAVSSYNILSMPYPTVTAKEATRTRLINVVAEQIGTRIAVFFKQVEQ